MDEEVIKRIPPNSAEAERSVIAAMLMDRDAVISASEILTGDDFYNRQYGIVFECMVELVNQGEPVWLREPAAAYRSFPRNILRSPNS